MGSPYPSGNCLKSGSDAISEADICLVLAVMNEPL